jgi:hypothetical protein
MIRTIYWKWQCTRYLGHTGQIPFSSVHQQVNIFARMLSQPAGSPHYCLINYRTQNKPWTENSSVYWTLYQATQRNTPQGTHLPKRVGTSNKTYVKLMPKSFTWNDFCLVRCGLKRLKHNFLRVQCKMWLTDGIFTTVSHRIIYSKWISEKTICPGAASTIMAHAYGLRPLRTVLCILSGSQAAVKAS